LVDVMAYVMNEGHPLGKPGKQYFNAITEGYLTAGLDTAVLDEAVQLSETEAV